MKSLFELYGEHQGKVSDKWSLYLSEYDRIFSPYREQPVRMLEIGIQNGGSLEVWSKYFPNALAFVGCDINQNCTKLVYEDSRIKVVVGDANTDSSETEILSHSPHFDLIVDDGSHTSSDIVKSFARYFRHLNYDGVFVAEDLHCSYWESYEGGLYYPYSSIAFFKRLADVINHEHWGIEVERRQLLKGFSEQFSTEFDELTLTEVHSIEFFNSVCVVHKRKAESNVLGERFIAGQSESVVSGHHGLTGFLSTPQSQSGNPWAAMKSAPEEAWEELMQLLPVRDRQIASLNQSVVERDSQIASLTYQIQSFINSTSWRLTKPVRQIGRQIAKMKQPDQNPLGAPRKLGCDEVSKATNDLVEECTEGSPGVLEDAAFEVLSDVHSAGLTNPYLRDDSKLIAFYLPQYHRIAENSEWWGPGFTEWTNVVKGKPNFDGHYQPHLPREFGFYDLSNVEVMREQAEMAKLYGVGAFCFYYYWFSGRRILEKPIDNFLASDIDIDYCLCWANENWTRTWDGDTRSVLMHQKYEESDPLAFITSLLPHFRDRRYIRVNGNPMLVVYRAKDIPDVKNVFAIWRKTVIEAGLPGLHITVVDFYDISTPMEVEADALVEFPPHKFNGPQSGPDNIPVFSNQKFRGGLVDYAKIMVQSAGRTRPDFPFYRGIIPSWDNTARRQDTPTIIYGATPKLFGKWLSYLRAYTRDTFSDRDDNFIFVNAWNEWGEGCHLEPDQKWGLGYLVSVAKSIFYQANGGTLVNTKDELLRAAAGAVLGHLGCEKPPKVSVDETVDRLVNAPPVGGLVQKMAFGLREHPFTYWCGRGVYRLYRKVTG